MQEKLENLLKKYEISASKQQIDEFCQFYNLLIEGNKVCNLTALTSEDDVLIKHFLDSVYPCKYFPLRAKVIDIGTGAGFPALPLKILRKDLNFTLLDSLNKRINFLNGVITSLNLTDITAFHGRAEDFAKKPEFREVYDVATARAVANLKVLAEYCLPFVKVGGVFIAYKSSNAKEEIKEAESMISTLGGKIDKVINYNLENNDRTLIIVKKVNNTKSIYPRKPNVIKK